MKKSLQLALFTLLLGACGTTPTDPRLQQIEDHTQAIHIKDGWIRDPYITLGPDDKYYLTGTTPVPNDPREQSDAYNIGLGKESIVGNEVRVWRSDDLLTWESMGSPYSLNESFEAFEAAGITIEAEADSPLWAPELHWLGDRWALVHCPGKYSTLALSEGSEVSGPWNFPNLATFKGKHDPSLFVDDDQTMYLLYGNTLIAPISDDMRKLTRKPKRIDPSDRRIGHEGATMRKIDGKYVHFGTAWSTDQMRKGSYNLYYCTSDSPMGNYDERKFVGRFLGHGTPFQDKAGNWWCTAFFNGNTQPLPLDNIESRDLSETAQTINRLGTTIVPLDVYTDPTSGKLVIRAKDPHYRNPGPDEAQHFDPM